MVRRMKKPSKSIKKVKKRKAEEDIDEVTKLSREERRFMKEYGETHPIHENKLQSPIETKVKRTSRKQMNTPLVSEPQPSSESDEDDIHVNPVSELLKLAQGKSRPTKKVRTDVITNLEKQRINTKSNKNEKKNTSISKDTLIEKESYIDSSVSFEERYNIDLSQANIFKTLKSCIENYPGNLVTNTTKSLNFGKVVYSRRLAGPAFPTKLLYPAKFDQFNLKPRIRVQEVCPEADDAQRELFYHFASYRDVVFPQRTLKGANKLREMYVLHALNHCLSTRTRILKNNERLKNTDDLEIHDQGFFRPKVLIVLPYKSEAEKVVKLLIKYAQGNLDFDKVDKEVRNLDRFEKEFQVQNQEGGPVHPNAEYRELFDGNTDDCFRIGISFNRTRMHLYSEFYSSDILIASPLGLRLIVGEKGDEKQEFDFLSSIEVLIVDQAESLLMQNWDHFLNVLKNINQTPQQTRDTDFSRLRRWVTEGWSKYFRQNIFLSAFLTPEMKQSVKTYSFNLYGQVEFEKPLKGSICQIAQKVPQAYHRIECQNFSDSHDARFLFFVDRVLPQFNSSLYHSVVIYIPSYFDFVRLRNYFRDKEINFGQIGDYTSAANVSRTRGNLFHGKLRFLLYTERYHYHHRPTLRGIQHLIFYGPPTFPQYYPEMLGMIQPNKDTTCTVLYTSFDMFALARITGDKRSERMVLSSQNLHMFA
eukprot:m.243960 g.243960  ORF g.243960 m.243960 type:complete len:702 (-) comp16099_c0_seq26:1603-3708(-)